MFWFVVVVCGGWGWDRTGGGPTDDWFRFYEQEMWKLSFVLLT